MTGKNGSAKLQQLSEAAAHMVNLQHPTLSQQSRDHIPSQPAAL